MSPSFEASSEPLTANAVVGRQLADGGVETTRSGRGQARIAGCCEAVRSTRKVPPDHLRTDLIGTSRNRNHSKGSALGLVRLCTRLSTAAVDKYRLPAIAGRVGAARATQIVKALIFRQGLRINHANSMDTKRLSDQSFAVVIGNRSTAFSTSAVSGLIRFTRDAFRPQRRPGDERGRIDTSAPHP